MGTTRECYVLSWINHGNNIPQNTNCTATYLPSHKPLSQNEQDMQDTAGEKKDKFIIDVLLQTPTHRCASVAQPARTYIQQILADTECHLEELPWAMDERNRLWVCVCERERERVMEFRAVGATWCWWWDICCVNKAFKKFFFFLIKKVFKNWIVERDKTYKKTPDTSYLSAS